MKREIELAADKQRVEQLNEPVLDDDYPVYAGYAYVADGVPISSPVEGTVKRLKAAIDAKEIRRCDLGGRNLW